MFFGNELSSNDTNTAGTYWHHNVHHHNLYNVLWEKQCLIYFQEEFLLKIIIFNNVASYNWIRFTLYLAFVSDPSIIAATIGINATTYSAFSYTLSVTTTMLRMSSVSGRACTKAAWHVTTFPFQKVDTATPPVELVPAFIQPTCVIPCIDADPCFYNGQCVKLIY